jgi:hypothetical protein
MDGMLELVYFGGPLCGETVKARAIDAFGIWLKGGVYRYSSERQAYVWREITW